MNFFTDIFIDPVEIIKGSEAGKSSGYSLDSMLKSEIMKEK